VGRREVRPNTSPDKALLRIVLSGTTTGTPAELDLSGGGRALHPCSQLSPQSPPPARPRGPDRDHDQDQDHDRKDQRQHDALLGIGGGQRPLRKQSLERCLLRVSHQLRFSPARV
jgi:hypothetical protein